MPQAYNDQINELKSNLILLNNVEFGGSDWNTTISELDKGLKILNTDFKILGEDIRAKMNAKMADWMTKNSAAEEYFPQIKALQQQLDQIHTPKEAREIEAAFNKIKQAAADAGKTGKSFGEGLMDRFKSLGQYLLSFASFYKIIDIGKQAISVVRDLDTALVELKKVTDESSNTYDNFMKSSFDMADKIGTTAKSVVASTADWARLGESFEEAQKSAQTATVLMNVSEFQNINEATEALVSAS
jgi:hypothetical protein